VQNLCDFVLCIVLLICIVVLTCNNACAFLSVQGDELFSNYGPLSNEKLLFAYGFALSNNPFDAVSVRLITASPQQTHHHSPSAGAGAGAADQRRSKDASKQENVFDILAGGIQGVPKVIEFIFCLFFE
jgi:hypothetical protein